MIFRFWLLELLAKMEWQDPLFLAQGRKGLPLRSEATAKPLEPPLFAPQKGDAKRSEAGGSRVQPRETTI